MSEHPGQPDEVISEEMSEYLQVFMDETDEQLDGLTETLLVLEKEPGSVEHLNEAFRLIHSIKGSAGMMGLNSIAGLTHHLESRFERLRSGVEQLDETTMNLVLRCIDFLRECILLLREGRPLRSAAMLLQEVSELNDAPVARETPSVPVQATPALTPTVEDGHHLVVRFEPGLPLVDLKARLILSRLSNIGDVVSSRPTAAELDGIEELAELVVTLVTDADVDTIRAAADVDGARSVEVGADAEPTEPPAPLPESAEAEPAPAPAPEPETAPVPEPEPEPAPQLQPTPRQAPPPPEPVAASAPPHEFSAPSPSPERGEKVKLAETMRVDIERLDDLMNLAGELVVNRARLVQVASEVTPAFRRRNLTSRMRDLGETLRRTIDHLRDSTNGQWATDIVELEAGLDLLKEQSEIWDHGRRGFAQIGEAIDQLTRISDSLQHGVLHTRMVPVAPLFNRFKRVVRDLAAERGKKVELVIRGEMTELDKRMIDELNEPLVHLIRNSIDHGLEGPELRAARGKPESGTIVLEASHSGNSVFIHVRDDGDGFDVQRIKPKILERGLLSAAGTEALTDAQAIEYIWHPGFSTAREVTDISGRGVGMDAVKTRITGLNGTVEVDSTPGEGTTITIRLPLTLAIINSLLIRVRGIVFSMPIEDVREIVSVQPQHVVTVHGKQTIDVRGEFIPLVGIDDVWRDFGNGAGPSRPNGGKVHAVILQSGERRMGFKLDEAIGSQDIVIKSLSENFIHIRGLSGASILGDGTVCLMLDVATIMDMVARRAGQESQG